MLPHFHKITRYGIYIVRRFFEDRCFQIAGSLTYTTLLALVPLFTVALTVMAAFPFFSGFIDQVKKFILANMVPETSSRVIGFYMEQFATKASHLTYIGIAAIAITALLLLFTIDEAFNTIWRTRRQQPWLKRILAYSALLTVGPVLIGMSLAMTSQFIRWAHSFERTLPLLDDTLLKIVPFILSAIALFLAYRIMPRRYVPGKHALIGAVIGAILFELIKHAFVKYLSLVPSYRLVYGAFAIVPIFLVWIFCCWTVVLIGAEIAATISYFRFGHERNIDTPLNSLRYALAILRPLVIKNDPMSLMQLRIESHLAIDQLEDTLEQLVSAGIVSETQTKFELHDEASEITLGEIVSLCLLGQRDKKFESAAMLNQLLGVADATKHHDLQTSLEQMYLPDTAKA